MNPESGECPAKFYIAVRRDLPPGPQLAQSVHAAIQFCQEWPGVAEQWYTESNFLVVVSMKDEDALKELAENARFLGIKYSAVQEPDYKDAWTAVALEPGDTARMMCCYEDLALKTAEEPPLMDWDVFIKN